MDVWICGEEDFGGEDPAFIYSSMLIDRAPASLHCCWEALATHMFSVKSLITKDKPVNPLGCHLSFAGSGGEECLCYSFPQHFNWSVANEVRSPHSAFDSQHSLHRKFTVVIVHLPHSAINKPSIRQPSTPL